VAMILTWHEPDVTFDPSRSRSMQRENFVLVKADPNFPKN
jgi:hypothetical protein